VLTGEKFYDKSFAYISIVANDMPPKKELTTDQQNQVVSQLLLLVKEGEPEQKLVHGALTNVAKNFNVTARMVRKIWKRVCQSFAEPTIAAFCGSPLKKNCCGRKKKYDCEEVREAISLVPLHERKTLKWFFLTERLNFTNILCCVNSSLQDQPDTSPTS
jgi:hypothetical protein